MSARVPVADAAPPDPVFRTEYQGEWVAPPRRDLKPENLPLALWGVFPGLPPVSRFEPVLDLGRPLSGRGSGQRKERW
jgi:hypothetical protein